MRELNNRKKFSLYNESLSRILGHAKEGTAMLISAFNEQYSFVKNLERHKQMLIDITNNHFGFLELIASHEETINIHGEVFQIPVSKYFIFIPYFERMSKSAEEFYQINISLAKSYEQESLLCIFKGKAKIENIKTNEVIELNDFSINTLNTYYSSGLSLIDQRDIEYSFAEGLTNMQAYSGNFFSGMHIFSCNERIMRSRGWEGRSLHHPLINFCRNRG